MIKTLISILVIIILLASNSIATEKLSTNMKLKETERLLIETADRISEGNINSALKVIKNLIKINPNFKLAHMIHGDLLLIQSHNYDQVSAETSSQFEKKITDLKLELSRRIESFNNGYRNIIQSKIKVLLAGGIKNLIFVDVKSSRLFVFNNNEGKLKYISDHYVSVGKKGYGKKFEGDKKTPIGTYFIENKITTKLIIAISSGAALSPKIGWFLYCSSKAAFKFLIESYALEDRKRKFINISPGLIKTKMQTQICKIDEKKIPSVKKFKNLNKSNKVPSPDEVAENILSTIQNLNKSSGSYLDIRKK